MITGAYTTGEAYKSAWETAAAVAPTSGYCDNSTLTRWYRLSNEMACNGPQYSSNLIFSVSVSFVVEPVGGAASAAIFYRV